MNKYFYTFIAMFVLNMSIYAQSKQQKNLAALVETFNNAIIRTDSTALKGMLMDELTYGHSSGVIQNKSEFIQGVMKGPNFFKKIDLLDQTITVSGKNAIVRHKATAQVINNGMPGEIKFGNILMWKRKQGKWKLLARQGYKI